MKNPSSPRRVSFDGIRPLALTKKQAVSALGSSKLVARSDPHGKATEVSFAGSTC